MVEAEHTSSAVVKQVFSRPVIIVPYIVLEMSYHNYLNVKRIYRHLQTVSDDENMRLP